MENCLRCKGPRVHAFELLICETCWNAFLVWRVREEDYYGDNLLLFPVFIHSTANG